MRRRPESLARAQGGYLLLTGVWPLVHYRSFEWVSGPKVDRWLVQTVGGLGATIGWAMLRGRAATQSGTARRLGVGSALTFGLVDAVYGGSGRIRRIYLADAVVQAGWLAAWVASPGSSPSAEHSTGPTCSTRPVGADPLPVSHP